MAALFRFRAQPLATGNGITGPSQNRPDLDPAERRHSPQGANPAAPFKPKGPGELDGG